LISTNSIWPDACRWGLTLQQILSINVKGSQLTTKVPVANIEVKQLLSKIPGHGYSLGKVEVVGHKIKN
jgi:hypothetical protein